MCVLRCDGRRLRFPNNVAALVSYALYLCTQSHMTCEPAMRNVKTVDGTAHYEIRYADQAACQHKLDELNKKLG